MSNEIIQQRTITPLTEDVSKTIANGVNLILSEELTELLRLYPNHGFMLINSNFSEKYKLEVVLTAIPKNVEIQINQESK